MSDKELTEEDFILQKAQADLMEKRKANPANYRKNPSGIAGAVSNCKAKAEKAPNTAVKAPKTEGYEMVLNKFHFPARYDGATVEQMISKDTILRYYFSTKIFPRALAAGRGLVFCGVNGRGKTRFIYAFVRAYIIANANESRTDSKYPLVLDFQEFLNNITVDVDWRKFLDKCIKSPVLIIDDFMSITTTERELSQITYMVTKRYHAMKPIIMTSNLNPKKLEEACQKTLWERILYVNYHKELTGKSKRKDYDKFTLDDLK